MRTNWLVVTCLTVLAVLSVLTLRSVAPAVAGRQVIFFGLAMGVWWLIGRVPLWRLSQNRWWLYGGLLVLLVVPLLIGTTTRGIKAWIDIGPWFSIQPSQLAIPIVALVIGELTSTDMWRSWWRVCLVFAVVLAPAGLIMLEPDLGTTFVYLVSMGALLFYQRLPLKVVGGILSLGVIVAVASWFWWLAPYQKDRLTSFMGANQSTDASYNARQSLIAVGSGQLLGRGLGQGIQSHLRFLPERQTDFVFASLAEEWGFFGSITVLICYGLLVYWLWQLATSSREPWMAGYAISLMMMLVAQVGINVGMNMGLVPITGITLPFLSYGGSSLLSLMAMMAVANQIEVQRPRLADGDFT